MKLSKTIIESNGNLRERIRQKEKVWPPPIPYAPKKKGSKAKGSDSKDDDEDKTKYITLDIKMDPTKEGSDTYEKKVPVFKDGTAEEWTEWRKTMKNLFTLMGVENDGAKMHHVIQAAMAEKAKDEYLRAFNSRVETNMSRPEQYRHNDLEVLSEALNDTAKKFFDDWKNAVRVQRNYMRTCLFIGGKDPDDFFDRIEVMNEAFEFFPYRDGAGTPNCMSEEEVMDIADNAKKFEWHVAMLSQGKHPSSFDDLEDLKTYFKQLYNADQLTQQMTGPTRKNERGHKRKRDKDKNPIKRKLKCKHCGKQHESDDCWTLPENKHKRPKHYRDDRKKGRDTFTREETANMFTTVFKSLAKEQKKAAKKRKVNYESDGEQVIDANMLKKLSLTAKDSGSDTDSDSSDN